MSATFIGTGQADITAQTTYLFGHLAITSHRRCSQTTDGCAVRIKHDAALLHHPHITFFQASCKAGVAGSSTCVALFDAGRIGVGCSQSYLLLLRERSRSVRVDEVNEYPVELLSMREVASMWPIPDDMHFTALHHLMCA